MTKGKLIAAGLVVAAFLYGLVALSGLHGEDHGWAGIGLVFITGPCVLGLSFIGLIISYLVDSKKAVGVALTIMAMTAAFMAGILVAG